MEIAEPRQHPAAPSLVIPAEAGIQSWGGYGEGEAPIPSRVTFNARAPNGGVGETLLIPSL